MRICVVGGGAAGLGMAWFLEQAGYHDVTVLEREPRLGGKCRTIWLDGLPYDMGAVEVTKEYRVVLDLIERFELPLTSVPGGRILDRRTGDTRSVLSLFDDVPKLELLAQFARFVFKQAELADYLCKPGFAGMPASLRGVSFSQWLRDIDAPALERFFWMPLTCYGYGSLERIPAVYALKFITVMPFHFHAHRLELDELLPSELRLFEPFVQRLTFGIQLLMERIGGTLTVPPVLSAKIEKVVRGPAGVVVRYCRGDDPAVHEERFDRLVVAIPQTLDALSFLDLGDEERRLFAQVSTIPYYTSLTKPRTLDYKLFYELADAQAGELGPPALPHVLQFARCWKDGLGSVFYTSAPPDAPIPLAGGAGSVEALVRAATLAANQVPGDSIQSVAWSYFPQVPQASLDAGFYDELEAIQGCNATYWTGALLNFELVEKVMEYSKHIVERFFAVRAADG